MTIFRSGRRRLAGDASGFGDGFCSVGVCMGPFRLVGLGSPPPKAPVMPTRKGAGNASFPASDCPDFAQSVNYCTRCNSEPLRPNTYIGTKQENGAIMTPKEDVSIHDRSFTFGTISQMTDS